MGRVEKYDSHVRGRRLREDELERAIKYWSDYGHSLRIVSSMFNTRTDVLRKQIINRLGIDRFNYLQSEHTRDTLLRENYYY